MTSPSLSEQISRMHYLKRTINEITEMIATEKVTEFSLHKLREARTKYEDELFALREEMEKR